MRHWSADTLFWHLSTDRNMNVYYQVKHRLKATTLARKFGISHWFPCGADGRADGRTVTWLSTFLGWIDYQIFLDTELFSRACGASLRWGAICLLLSHFPVYLALIAGNKNTSASDCNKSKVKCYGDPAVRYNNGNNKSSNWGKIHISIFIKTTQKHASAWL